MFDAELTALLEGGCALIVGTVDQEGEPHAARGWGLTILPAGIHPDREPRVRLLLDAANERGLDDLRQGSAAIAVTAADVPTLRSVQLKGHVVRIEPASNADRAKFRRYRDAFFDDIVHVDRFPRHIVERHEAAAIVAAVMEVDHVFDQTPGPGAGAALSESTDG